MEPSIIFAIILIPITTILTCIAICVEKREFNNGICKKCGEPLRYFGYFENDSQGCRHYICDKCNHMVQVDYHIVDKKYRK